MSDYVIEKQHKNLSGKDWGAAWGNKHKYPKASSDQDAVQIFNEATKNCRTPYRLIKFVGFGYNVSKVVLAEINIEEKIS